MTRRSTHVEHEVLYAAVGASANPDLLRFPPEGATPYFDELRLGSGAERFLTASSLLMTWGAPRGVGIRVTDVVPGDGGQYAGVTFTPAGVPEPATAPEVQFGPDGEPYLTAGTVARFVWPDDVTSRQVRVVYTIDEAARVGYAIGSADGDGVIGEEAFAVEHREDDSVWATVRGFLWAPSAGFLGLKGRAAIRYVVKQAKDQLAALAPGGQSVAEEAIETPPDARAESGDTDAASSESLGHGS